MDVSIEDTIFRRADANDIGDILSLIDLGAVAPTPSDISTFLDVRYRQSFQEIDHDPSQALLVGDCRGNVLSTMHLTFIPGLPRLGRRRAIIEFMHVHPEARAQGLGRKMMRYAFAIASERNCGIIELTSQKERVEAHRFYRTLGFRQSHEGFKFLLDDHLAPPGQAGLEQ